MKHICILFVSTIILRLLFIFFLHNCSSINISFLCLLLDLRYSSSTRETLQIIYGYRSSHRVSNSSSEVCVRTKLKLNGRKDYYLTLVTTRIISSRCNIFHYIYYICIYIHISMKGKTILFSVNPLYKIWTCVLSIYRMGITCLY